MVTARRTVTETQTRAPIVVAGTLDGPQAEAFKDAVAASEVDPRVWTGAFATNVWGGRFAVDGVLGAGSQGTTFSGTDLKTGAKVAVKVFDLGRAKDWKSQELFEREVETLKAVEHAGIPRFLDVIIDADTGARALVRTLIPGDSLADVMQKEGALSEGALWNVLVDAADVLGALHARSSPIVHRDIKPSNLIRRPDGKICLVDFGGVGRMREAAGSTVVGTFGYMAPEQLYGAQSPATDMYSLGATLLALATGQEPEELPRDGLSLDVDKAAPSLSPALRALLQKLTAPDPKARPQDAQHLLGELKTIAGAKAATAPRAPIVDAVAPTGDGAVFVGIVSLVFGMLGVAGAVVVGELLLPLLITILAAASQGEQRERLNRAKIRVREAARMARGSFQSSAQHGALTLEKVAERDKVRRLERKLAHKEQRRAMKAQWREDARRMREEHRQRQREIRDAHRRRR
ncbi:MAG TPA: protein kinase [Myxococcota bacterium]|jgi:hypothetical protein